MFHKGWDLYKCTEKPFGFDLAIGIIQQTWIINYNVWKTLFFYLIYRFKSMVVSYIYCTVIDLHLYFQDFTETFIQSDFQ